MSTTTETMTKTMAKTTAETTSVSKAVQEIDNIDITNLSERIAEAQTFLDHHEQTRKTHMTAFKRHAKTVSTSLDKGMSSLHESLAHMDKSIEYQKLICDETDEIAKFGRELMELLEERQNAIRSMIEETSA
jgi:hypothetical protein